MTATESNRIVVTGIGLCTPLGPDRESSWREILAGKSGVRWLNAPHWTDPTPLAGAPVVFPKHRPRLHAEPLVELALTTASESLADARLNKQDLADRVVGVVFGNSKGGLHTFSKMYAESREQTGTERSANSETTDPHSWLDVFPNRAAMSIREMIGGYGPVFCPVAACATGLAACLRAAQLLENGDCDIALAGSADVSLQPAVLASFRRLGVLSHEKVDAALACRPFDRNRSGFVVGEGAACLVMEKRDSAIARGATCYAEWLGGLMLSDPFGLTQLDLTGASLQKLLRSLANMTGRLPDYINLHGTATLPNDLVECRSIREVFRSDAGRIDCSSLKGGLGHLLGAAGSVELAATALAIRDQVAPPTVNLAEPDPECRLNLTPNKAKPSRIEHAWKISMGFGGHIAGACLGRL